MKFCTNCNNYLYVDLDEEKNLIRYCKNCAHKVVEKKENGIFCFKRKNDANNENMNDMVNVLLSKKP